MEKKATTRYPIMAELEARWSPRAFDATYELSNQEWGSLFEAARWSPSASNSQPWQFVVGARGSELFARIFETLKPGNKLWTSDVSALVVNVIATENEEGKPNRYALYDLGQAVAHLSIQASHLGLFVHQMAGFEQDALHEVLGLDDRHSPMTMMAIGKVAEPEVLPEQLQERERAERVRKPLSEVAPGLFS